MTRPRCYYAPTVPKPSPHDAELDRLLALLERGAITRSDYLKDVAAVKRAQKLEAVR